MARNNLEDKTKTLREAGNDQVIILKDDDESKKRGSLSWTAIGRHLNKFKYWVLGATLLAAIVGFVGVQYIYNPSRNAFTATFSLDLKQTANKDDALKGKLLNGDSYDVRDIVKTNNLERTIEIEHDRAVAKAKADYIKEHGNLDGFDESKVVGKYDFFDKDVDMNGLLNIVVARTGGNTSEIIVNTYVLSGKLAYFDTAGIAKSFINDAIKSYIGTLGENYDLPHKASEAANDYDFYDHQVGALQASYASINKGFTNLRENFSVTSRLKDGRTLADVIRGFNNDPDVGSGSVINSIVAEQENTGYVKGYNDDSADKPAILRNYQNQETSIVLPAFREAKTKKTEYADILKNGEKLSEEYLRDVELQLNLWSAKYESSLHQKILIGSRLKALGDATQGTTEPEDFDNPYRPAIAPDISAAPEANFATRVNKSKDALNFWGETYVETSKYLLFESTQIVFYADSEKIILTQALPSYLGAVGGALLGFVVSAFVVVVIGQGQRKRQLYFTGIDPIDVYELPEEKNTLADTPSDTGTDLTKKQEPKGGKDETTRPRGDDESAADAKPATGDKRAKSKTGAKGKSDRK